MVSRVHQAVLAALIVLMLPAVGRAVTLDDIIALSKAGVGSEILIAVIDADRTIFNLTTGEIVNLKKAGVPNDVIVKMLGTAREFVDEVPPPLIVGTDRPSAAETTARPSAVEMYSVPTFAPVGPYFVVPYPVFVAPGVFAPTAPGTPASVTQPVHGFGRFMTGPSLGREAFGRVPTHRFIDPPRAPSK
jgi:hypothetical protein